MDPQRRQLVSIPNQFRLADSLGCELFEPPGHRDRQIQYPRDVDRYSTLATANIGALFTSDPLSLVGALFASDPLSLGTLFTSGLNNIPVDPSLLQRLC
jgi:hypothetical protein